MKIAYLAMTFRSYDGISHEVLQAKTLAEAGHEVLLMVNQVPPWKEPLPPRLRQIVLPIDQMLAKGVYELPKSVAEADWDVAFASSASGAPFLANLKARTQRPVVTQILDFPTWRLRIKAGPWRAQWTPWFQALGAMDHVIFNTEVNRSEASEACQLFGKPTSFLPASSVVYYGVDTRLIDSVLMDESAESAQLYPTLPQCMSTSRLVFYKGHDLALMGLARVPKSKRPAYVVVGDGEDSERLMQMSQVLGVEAGFVGGCTDREKVQVMKGSQFGLALAWNPHIPYQCPLEVVYSGRPCIVADTKINRERFGDHGVTYVDPFDPDMIGFAVTRPLTKVGEAERSWIRENRSFESHAQGVLNVLESAI